MDAGRSQFLHISGQDQQSEREGEAPFGFINRSKNLLHTTDIGVQQTSLEGGGPVCRHLPAAGGGRDVSPYKGAYLSELSWEIVS